jgi:hypothetical protein
VIKNVLSSDLKMSIDLASFRDSGKVFHGLGAAVEKDRSPYEIILDLGMMRLFLVLERRLQVGV